MSLFNQKPRVLSGIPSIFLDSLRIAASLIVFVYHIYLYWYPATLATVIMRRTAHTSVTIFFVLSGFVIAYMSTNKKKNNNLFQYLEARFSKLFSAGIPTLVITAVIEIIVIHVNPQLHALYARGSSWPRYIFSGLFLNEIWFRSLAPPINAPLWSLGFEFWYYLIFGLFFYRKGKGWKSLLPGAIACIIGGPKILMMMPIWLFGYYAYKLPRINCKTSTAWLLVTFFMLLAIAAIVWIQPYPGTTEYPPLFFAGEFVTDWLVGFLIAAAFWCIPSASSGVKVVKYPLLRKTAELTFPLYILHFPFIILHAAFHKAPIKHDSELILPGIIILAVCVFTGIYTEKYRYLWSRFFKSVLSKLPIHKKDPAIEKISY